MVILAMVAALILDVIGIALLIVCYRTIRDIWDEIADIERRIRKLEHKN